MSFTSTSNVISGLLISSTNMLANNLVIVALTLYCCVKGSYQKHVLVIFQCATYVCCLMMVFVNLDCFFFIYFSISLEERSLTSKYKT